MKGKSTKSALLMSFTSLLLCFAMLIGCTFAWFTDSVTSGVNKIQAGNLDIEVSYKNTSTGSYANLQGSETVFSQGLWEPGHTEFVTLKVENKGSLALKYQVMVTPVSETEGVSVKDNEKFKLSDYLVFGTTEASATEPSYTRDSARAAVGTTKKLNQTGLTKGGTMEPNSDAQYITLVVYMPEEVGNEANYLTGTTPPQINLGITVVATQLASEFDSFDQNYDALAPIDTSVEYSSSTVAFTPVNKDEEGSVTAQQITKYASDDHTVHTQLDIPASRVADDAENMSFLLEETAAPAGLTVAATQGSKNYELSVVGLKEGTDVIIGKMFVGMGLTGVKFYHNITEEFTAVTSAAEVDAHGEFFYGEDGYITFATTSFSPFSVLFNASEAATHFGTMDEMHYLTIGEAIETSAPIVTLTADLNDRGEIELKPGMALDGTGHKITGNTDIKVDPAGATVKNVVFENIHNTQPAEADDCQKYGWESKIGTLCAIYARGLTGTLTVKGCSFDNIDWEAIQTTPKTDSKINIIGNTFKHTSTQGSQLRHVHIEATTSNTVADIRVTDNLFYNTDARGENPICNIGIYNISCTPQGVKHTDCSGNWFETIGNNDIKNGSSTYIEVIYPARTQPDADVDDLLPAAKKVVSPVEFYDTLQEAINAVQNAMSPTVSLMRDNAEVITVPNMNGKTLQIQGSYKLTNKLINNGNVQLFTSKSESTAAGAVIVNNGSLEISNNNSWLDYTIENYGRLIIAGTGNGTDVANPAKIINHEGGVVIISGGKYTTAPDADWIAFGYQAELQDGVYSITKRTFANDDEAFAAGAIAKYTKNGVTTYWGTLSGKDTGNAYLMKDVTENVTRTAALYLYAGDYKYTGSIEATGYGINIKSGSADLNMLNCKTLTLGTSSTPIVASIHSGTISSNVTLYGTLNIDGNTTLSSYLTLNKDTVANITEGTFKSYFDVKAGATLNISGGTFTKVPTETSQTLRNAGTINISGGTFKFDPTTYVISGYHAVNNGSGTWTVVAD